MTEPLVLINDKEMKFCQSLNYEELLDWQFNLMQEVVDTANEIIHKEYKDDHILQQGLIMMKRMVLVQMASRAFVDRFPESEMTKLLEKQYSMTTRKEISPLITDEIQELKEHFDEIEEVLTKDFENSKRRVDAMDTVNRIATLNLREYEDALNRVFSESHRR
jgi:ferritin-like metal-binding protein YciE